MVKMTSKPKGLSKEAANWWNQITEEFDLEPASLIALECALTSFDRMRQAQAAIKKYGVVIAGTFPRANPACKIEVDAKRTMLASLREIGLDLEPLFPSPGRPPGGGR